MFDPLSLSHPLSFVEVFVSFSLSHPVICFSQPFCHLLRILSFIYVICCILLSLSLSLSRSFFFVFWSFLVVLNCPSLSLSDFLLFSKVFNSFPVSDFLPSEQFFKVFLFVCCHLSTENFGLPSLGSGDSKLQKRLLCWIFSVSPRKPSEFPYWNPGSASSATQQNQQQHLWERQCPRWLIQEKVLAVLNAWRVLGHGPCHIHTLSDVAA